jgi:methionine aminopeptidase
MRKAGRLVAECLDMSVPEIRSGVTTEHIKRLVFEFAMDYGAMPATLTAASSWPKPTPSSPAQTARPSTTPLIGATSTVAEELTKRGYPSIAVVTEW